MSRIAAGLASIGLILMPMPASAACSCAKPRPRPPDAVSAATFAVLARVNAVRTIDSFVDSTTSPRNPRTLQRELLRFHRYEIELVVERRFKGTPDDTIRVVTEFDSCTYFGPYEPPHLGEQHFLVFYQDPASAPLQASDCGGSTPWELVDPTEREALMKLPVPIGAPAESDPSVPGNTGASGTGSRQCRSPMHRRPDAPTIRLSSSGDSLATFLGMAPEAVADVVSGSYRLLSVSTEGAKTRSVAEWKLQLAARDVPDVPIPELSGDPEGTLFPADGEMDLVAAYYLTGERRDNRIEDAFVAIAYDSSRGTLWLRGEPFEIGRDDGSFDQIFSMDADGTLHGRWVWPAQAYDILRTPLVEVHEYPAGYFCAWRTGD